MNFLFLLSQSNKYVMATKDYITRESTLLSFKKGDIIKLMDADLDDGMSVVFNKNYLYQILTPLFWNYSHSKHNMFNKLTKVFTQGCIIDPIYVNDVVILTLGLLEATHVLSMVNVLKFSTFLSSVCKWNVGYQDLKSQNACLNSKQGRPRSDCFFRSVWLFVYAFLAGN